MPTYIYAPGGIAQGVPYTPVPPRTLASDWPADMAANFVDITSASPQPVAGDVLTSGTWGPAPPAAVTSGGYISDPAFFARFTPAEAVAVQSASLATPALEAELIQGVVAGGVITSSPAVVSWMGDLVSAGAVTSARAAQILDLTEVSPPTS